MNIEKKINECLEKPSFEEFQLAYSRLKQQAATVDSFKKAVASVREKVAGNTSRRILPAGFETKNDITKAQYIRYKRQFQTLKSQSVEADDNNLSPIRTLSAD